MVSVGGGLVWPTGAFDGYSLAFEPRLSAVHFFSGSGVQIGLGAEIGFQTATRWQSSFSDFTDRFTSLNLLGILSARVPLTPKKSSYFFFGPGIGISRINREENFFGRIYRAAYSALTMTSRAGFIFHLGRRISLQPEIGIYFTANSYLRIQPGLQVGFHF